ncbi:hypothetical protein [Deinococcus roseus]|uniref:Uncharacterized protein n=1 Tax=Deinococcus roseus TaxID=392414 RepID=A0ABQ2DCI7_9DEIO|nr:hypothetical protein [Deinococcus roseus]GGJ52340.1 hypothetical protein GCM10008938_42940 [Deinococcus roseus]
MECICVCPSFQPDPAQPTMRVEVYADAGRDHLLIVLYPSRFLAIPSQQMAGWMEMLYQQELIRYLTPSTTLRWYCLTEGSNFLMELVASSFSPAGEIRTVAIDRAMA